MRMPDLAVEIQSPADRPHQMREKALYYLQKGSQVVWLIYWPVASAEVCTLDASGNLTIETVESSDALTASDALPGFSLPLADLFGEM